MSTNIPGKTRIVIDTTALISYFGSVFAIDSKISSRGIDLIREAFQEDGNTLLVIPSIVFVEIFDKWVRDEEFQAKIRSEIFEPVKQSPNIEIRPIDKEVLENFITLVDDDINLENHDRLILASAVVLNAPLITSDRKIRKFVNRHHVIPRVIA